jgi:multisubunit Na+/H+ antiporter MnhG subunit
MNRRRSHVVKEVHHGRTVAAWTGSMLALFAFIIMTVGFLTGPGDFPSINVPITVAGGVVLLLAPIVGGVMNKLGHGQD